MSNIVDTLRVFTGKGYVWTSTNAGLNWMQQTGMGAGGWGAIASSSDGNKLAIGGCTSNLRTTYTCVATSNVFFIL